ncbi:MAG: CDP-glycerol glycerophosphotransferase family protein [Simkaniaceae bacterium]
MKAAALLEHYHPHHIDHFAPLCYFLKIPLLTLNDEIFELTKKEYPYLEIKKIDRFTPFYPYLAHNYDMLFITLKHKPFELICQLRFYNQKMQIIYIPHGNSDKASYSSLFDPFPVQEKALIYGEQMAEAAKLNHIRMGNMRLKLYQTLKPSIPLSLPPHKKTILYAPTWHEETRPSTLLDTTLPLIQSLPADVELLIKFHPMSYNNALAQIITIKEQTQNHPGIHFIENTHAIYPLLAACDAYLGDYSSIGYDFLSFDKPLFFFNPLNLKNLSLQKVGLTITDPKQTFEQIEKHNPNDYAYLRKKLYDYTFDPPIDPERLKSQILTQF